MDSQQEQELRILEEIERNPDITQADMAARLNVAVGSVNWYIKRLINKGYVKVRQMQRRKLKYFVTPQGLAVKAHLTSQYMKASMRLYRETREAATQILAQVGRAGYHRVRLVGDSDLGEVCYLTCVERGVEIADVSESNAPTLKVEGLTVTLEWPVGVPLSSTPVDTAADGRFAAAVHPAEETNAVLPDSTASC